ncbi:MAG: LamG domain-containing protein [Phycisphaerales bacterium]|nr:MAG: LamG domain-containing protein [Phycisphaerales bacterium]
MYKVVLFIFVVLSLSLTISPAVADPNLVGWWKLDDEGTSTAIDYSGYDRPGSLHGDPQFVSGMLGDALQLDANEYVVIDGYKGVLGTHAFSITSWINTSVTDTTMQLAYWGTHSAGQRVEYRIQSNRLRMGAGNGYVQGDTSVTDGEWHHVAVTIVENAGHRDTDITFYRDGSEDTRAKDPPDDDPINIVPKWDVSLGYRLGADDRPFMGLIDDVRIYDKVLSQKDIARVMRINPNLSSDPSPADGSRLNAGELTAIAWFPGDSAAEHDVYLGTDEQAVANADTSGDEYQGRQSEATYVLSDIQLGRAYFWRIDEVSGLDVWKGEVWGFEVEEYLVVDDFDSYGDSNELQLVWDDGEDNGTGSTISLEDEFVGNSMKVEWDNSQSPFKSDVDLILGVPQDWTKGGAKALELQYRGDANNPIMSLYVRLEDAGNRSAAVRHDDPNVLVQESWQGWRSWVIALEDFVDIGGIDLANIKKVTVGIGDGADPSPVVSLGFVNLDYIRLYPPRCLPEHVLTSFDDDCDTDAEDLNLVLSYWLAGDYTVTATKPDNGDLQAYYKFDETSGTVASDSSGRDLHATVDSNGADAWDASGQDGGCLNFDGTFGVSVPNGVFTDVRDEVTISVWVHVDSDVNPNTVGRVEFGAGPEDPNEQWDRLSWVQEEHENDLGRWSHYAFVKDAGDGMMRIYHNGLLVAQNTDAFQPMDGAAAGPSTIGARNDGEGGYYQGKLDEFRIYNYALSHAEVLYLAAGRELHQPLQPVLSPVDPYEDGAISFEDLAVLAQRWLTVVLWP